MISARSYHPRGSHQCRRIYRKLHLQAVCRAAAHAPRMGGCTDMTAQNQRLRANARKAVRARPAHRLLPNPDIQGPDQAGEGWEALVRSSIMRPLLLMLTCTVSQLQERRHIQHGRIREPARRSVRDERFGTRRPHLSPQVTNSTMPALNPTTRSCSASSSPMVRHPLAWDVRRVADGLRSRYPAIAGEHSQRKREGLDWRVQGIRGAHQVVWGN